MLERANEILQLEIKALSSLMLTTDLERCVELFLSCRGKIIFTGMGKAGIIGRKIAATLSSTGTPALFLNPGEAVHGDLGIISNDDVIVALSNSGKTREVLLMLELCRKGWTASMVGICSTKRSEMAKYCDVMIELGKVKEACPFGLAPTCSTTAMLVIGDILAILTMEQKGFTIEEYGHNHHAGYINVLIKEQIEGKTKEV